ncbi:MAG TPA: MauE/DoxX family redox-associated membrane protein [Solirubrobacteraceae bacterium]
MDTVAETLLALVLLAAAALKLRDRERSADALATYGLGPADVRRVALALIVAAELALAGALIAGVGWAPAVACGVFAAFALAATGALIAGRAGRPCACFGARSRLSPATAVESLLGALLALAAAEGWLGNPPGGYARGLTVAVTASLALAAVLAAVVFALAREVGVLRLSLAGRGALEIPEEGPPVGVAQPWAGELAFRPGTLLALAIFSSDGCPMCRQLEPAVAYVAADPLLTVRVFDEAADAATWAAAAVPGSPYAVALDAAGVTLAKGTFNSLVQLEGIVATARTRDTELALAG